MRIRLSTAAALSAAFLSGWALFLTSQQVQTKEEKLKHLEEAVASEQETIRVLSAEWSYLNRPERLESLAQEYLGMQPAQTAQIVPAVSGLPNLFVPALPRRKPAFTAQPAVFTSPPSPVSFPEKIPSPVHVDHQSSQSLLQKIGKETK
jgi:hypothetical protein